MKRLVELTLMVDVKAWESVNQQAVDALVDGLGRLSTHLSRVLLDPLIESPRVVLNRREVGFGASQVTVKSALVALEQTCRSWDLD